MDLQDGPTFISDLLNAEKLRYRIIGISVKVVIETVALGVLFFPVYLFLAHQNFELPSLAYTPETAKTLVYGGIYLLVLNKAWCWSGS